MRMKKVIPVLLAAVLVCISNVGSANAYFTTYVTAKGGYEVSWEHHERMNEDFHDWNKYVSITSKEGSVPVYVRVKAFTGSKYILSYEGEAWEYNEIDGYYYYKTLLYGGETTSSLKIEITNIPTVAEDGDNFNVVVIYETVPAQTNEEGGYLSPTEADWTGAKSNE